jgi:transposase
MNTQLALQLPSSAPSNTVVINARCMLRTEADQRVVVVGGLPVYHYCVADTVAEAYAMVMLVDSGFAQQTEVARAFGKSDRTIRRHQERYAQSGMAGLGRPQGWRRGRRRLSGKRLRVIEKLKSQGLSNRAIAQRLGLSEMAIRKQVGSLKCEEVGQLALVPTPVAPTSEAPAAQTSSTRASTDSAQEPTVIRDEAKPVPLSLDHDASDRTLDRQMAYLGLLDDAAPIFRDGSQVPGVGVLLSLPYLMHSGLLQIARKLYGGIGPAFYGLRTTLLTLFLMALLRIQRPEQLKERDPGPSADSWGWTVRPKSRP